MCVLGYLPAHTRKSTSALELTADNLREQVVQPVHRGPTEHLARKGLKAQWSRGDFLVPDLCPKLDNSNCNSAASTCETVSRRRVCYLLLARALESQYCAAGGRICTTARMLLYPAASCTRVRHSPPRRPQGRLGCEVTYARLKRAKPPAHIGTSEDAVPAVVYIHKRVPV